jgi:hypothetical protein
MGKIQIKFYNSNLRRTIIIIINYLFMIIKNTLPMSLILSIDFTYIRKQNMKLASKYTYLININQIYLDHNFALGFS